MIEFSLKHPRMTQAGLGYLPSFLSEHDPRSATEQLHSNYVFGGWQPFKGFTLTYSGLKYPGDRPMKLLAEATLRDEKVQLYECSWVAVVQADGSYEVARLD